MEKDDLAALGLLGLNVADFITARYERAAATTLSEWSESSRSAQQKSICSKSGSAQPPPLKPGRTLPYDKEPACQRLSVQYWLRP